MAPLSYTHQIQDICAHLTQKAMLDMSFFLKIDFKTTKSILFQDMSIYFHRKKTHLEGHLSNEIIMTFDR